MSPSPLPDWIVERQRSAAFRDLSDETLRRHGIDPKAIGRPHSAVETVPMAVARPVEPPRTETTGKVVIEEQLGFL